MNFKSRVVAAKKYLNHTIFGAVLHVFNFVIWERGCLGCLSSTAAVTYFCFCSVCINTSYGIEYTSDWESGIRGNYLKVETAESYLFMPFPAFSATDGGRILQPIFQVFWAFISLAVKYKCGWDLRSSKCCPLMGHISTTWELLKEANSPALPQPHIFRKSEGGAQWSLFWAALWCPLNTLKANGLDKL